MVQRGQTGTAPGGVYLCAGVLILVACLSSFWWIGNVTIYAEHLEPARLLGHRMLITGQLPEGTASWGEIGASSAGTRILVPYLADWIASSTGIGVLKVYRAIDLVATLTGLIIAFAIFTRFVQPLQAVIGLSFLLVLLPLTFFLHVFHPYDRVSFALWALAIWLVIQNRPVLFAVVVAIAVAVKYDAVVLPGVFLIYHWGGAPAWRVLSRSAVAGVAAVAVAAWVFATRPESMESRPMGEQFLKNITALRGAWMSYPPFLAYAPLFAAILLGARRVSTGAKRLAACAVLAMIPHLLQTNFIEIRAQMGVILLLLPAALMAVLAAPTEPAAAAQPRFAND